jgi:DNA-binding SARP family transcriptional activator
MYLMSNCPSPLLGAPGSSSAVKARVDCMVRYRLLGPLEVESEAGRVDIGPPKRRAVLGALLLARGRVVSADRLVEAVWGDDAPERSSASLQVHVSTLRKTLQDQPGAAAGIVRQAPGYYLDLDPEQIDLTLFEAGCHSSRSAITAERWRDALAASQFALGLWRGPLLDDLGDREWIRRRGRPGRRAAQ